MNIAIFTDTYPPEINGVATSTYNLREILVKNGNKVLIITTNPFSNKVTFEEGIIRIPGINLKKMYGYRLAWFYNSKVSKAVRKFSPDVIHVHTDGGLGFFGRIASRFFKVPGVYTYHTMYEDYTYYFTRHFAGRLDRFARKFVRWFLHRIASMTDEFVTPSQKSASYLKTIGIRSYVSIVPTGLDFSHFASDRYSETEIKKFKDEHNISSDTYVILSLGRVAPEKSIDVLLRGYRNFLNEHPKEKTILLVVGDGPGKAELELLADELRISNRVIFVGQVAASEVPFYYALSDVFISASVTETQGLTFMEAMASHRIVLTRFDENLIDVVRDNETGFFFQNEKDFTQVLYRIMNMDEKTRKRITDTAFEAIDSYSIDKFYENIMRAYERAIRENW